MTSSPARTSDNTQFRKTKICQFFAAGKCRYGQGCAFAHGDVDLEASPDLTKTSLCVAWQTGTCRCSATQCAFAHGHKDLRRVQAAIKKNTKVASVRPCDGPNDDANNLFAASEHKSSINQGRSQWSDTASTRSGSRESARSQMLDADDVASPRHGGQAVHPVRTARLQNGISATNASSDMIPIPRFLGKNSTLQSRLRSGLEELVVSIAPSEGWFSCDRSSEHEAGPAAGSSSASSASPAESPKWQLGADSGPAYLIRRKVSANGPDCLKVVVDGSPTQRQDARIRFEL